MVYGSWVWYFMLASIGSRSLLDLISSLRGRVLFIVIVSLALLRILLSIFMLLGERYIQLSSTP